MSQAIGQKLRQGVANDRIGEYPNFWRYVYCTGIVHGVVFIEASAVEFSFSIPNRKSDSVVTRSRG